MLILQSLLITWQTAYVPFPFIIWSQRGYWVVLYLTASQFTFPAFTSLVDIISINSATLFVLFFLLVMRTFHLLRLSRALSRNYTLAHPESIKLMPSICSIIFISDLIHNMQVIRCVIFHASLFSIYLCWALVITSCTTLFKGQLKLQSHCCTQQNPLFKFVVFSTVDMDEAWGNTRSSIAKQ